MHIIGVFYANLPTWPGLDRIHVVPAPSYLSLVNSTDPCPYLARPLPTPVLPGAAHTDANPQQTKIIIALHTSSRVLLTPSIPERIYI